jgi:hypothetical protein
MSQRSISENLEYTVDNQGLHYSAPVIELDSAQGDLTGTWTINAVPILTGSPASPTINVGAAPNRELNVYFPKSYTVTKQVALVANTPQDIDWTALVAGPNSFPVAPTPGAASAFIAVSATTTDWSPQVMGEWEWTVKAVPTVTVGNTHTLKLSSLLTVNSGGAYSIIQELATTKGGAGTPSLDAIGGCSNSYYFARGTAIDVQRVKFNATCTENKTVDVTVKWTLLNPLF